MARVNFSYEKRQRELAKKRKKEEKRLRKLNPATPADGTVDADAPAPVAQADDSPRSPDA